jgi:hypothetical protein
MPLRIDASNAPGIVPREPRRVERRTPDGPAVMGPDRAAARLEAMRDVRPPADPHAVVAALVRDARAALAAHGAPDRELAAALLR